jgi:ParB family chromosome partitioning protein
MLTTKRYEYLNFDKIGVHPTIGNHRQLSSPKVTHLEKDILRNGLLEPLVVWERSPGEYYLVGGFHRLEAIKGIRKNNPGYFDRIDVRIVAGDPDEIKALNLKLNADRLDTKITDYFETVVYLNNVNWRIDRIAEFLDKSTSWIEEILKFAPMINEQLRSKLENGELSWNRAKEIIQKTIQAPVGSEREVLNEEILKSQARVAKVITFKSVFSHFSKVKSKNPEKTYTFHINDLYSFARLLRGKEYDKDDISRIKSLFPDLVKEP